MIEIKSLKGTVHMGPRDLSFQLTLGLLNSESHEESLLIAKNMSIQIRKETTLWLAHRSFRF